MTPVIIDIIRNYENKIITQSRQKSRNYEKKATIMIFNQHNIFHINSRGGNGFYFFHGIPTFLCASLCLPYCFLGNMLTCTFLCVFLIQLTLRVPFLWEAFQIDYLWGSILRCSLKFGTTQHLCTITLSVCLSYQYIVYASAWAGSCMFGSFSSSWIPNRIWRKKNSKMSFYKRAL